MTNDPRLVRHPADDTLHALMDGVLPPRAAADVERHVAACAQCGAHVERLERLRRLAVGAPREVAPPDAVWAAVRARVAATPQVVAPEAPRAPAMPTRARRSALVPWAAALALLVPAGGATLLVARGRRADPVAPPAAAPVAEVNGVTPEARRAAAEDLRALDAAVASTAAVLAAHPDNVHLETMLAHARQQREEYAQTARTLTSSE